MTEPEDGIESSDASSQPPIVDTSGSLIHRPCPLCGTKSSSNDIAVRAPIRAETLNDQDRAEYWRGFRNRSCFFDFVRCIVCGLLFCPTYFSQEALDELYSSMQDNTAGAAVDVLSDTQSGYIKFLSAHRPLKGTYLEVGPDIGLATAAACASGQIESAVLIEPNKDVYDQLQQAAGSSPTEIVASLDELDASTQADNAVLIHVLDHLIDPLSYLRDLRRHLSADAMLLVVVHNHESFLRRVLGVRWPPFCLQHPQLFSRRTLEGILRTAGFEFVAYQPTTNVFPLRHVVATGVSLTGLPVTWTDRLPNNKIRLRLGNIMMVAKA